MANTFRHRNTWSQRCTNANRGHRKASRAWHVVTQRLTDLDVRRNHSQRNPVLHHVSPSESVVIRDTERSCHVVCEWWANLLPVGSRGLPRVSYPESPMCCTNQDDPAKELQTRTCVLTPSRLPPMGFCLTIPLFVVPSFTLSRSWRALINRSLLFHCRQSPPLRRVARGRDRHAVHGLWVERRGPNSLNCWRL